MARKDIDDGSIQFSKFNLDEYLKTLTEAELLGVAHILDCIGFAEDLEFDVRNSISKIRFILWQEALERKFKNVSS